MRELTFSKFCIVLCASSFYFYPSKAFEQHHLHIRLVDRNIQQINAAATAASGLGNGAGEYLSLGQVAELSGRTPEEVDLLTLHLKSLGGHSITVNALRDSLSVKFNSEVNSRKLIVQGDGNNPQSSSAASNESSSASPWEQVSASTGDVPLIPNTVTTQAVSDLDSYHSAEAALRQPVLDRTLKSSIFDAADTDAVSRHALATPAIGYKSVGFELSVLVSGPLPGSTLQSGNSFFGYAVGNEMVGAVSPAQNVTAVVVPMFGSPCGPRNYSPLFYLGVSNYTSIQSIPITVFGNAKTSSLPSLNTPQQLSRRVYNVPKHRRGSGGAKGLLGAVAPLASFFDYSPFDLAIASVALDIPTSPSLIVNETAGLLFTSNDPALTYGQGSQEPPGSSCCTLEAAIDIQMITEFGFGSGATFGFAASNNSGIFNNYTFANVAYILSQMMDLTPPPDVLSLSFYYQPQTPAQQGAMQGTLEKFASMGVMVTTVGATMYTKTSANDTAPVFTACMKEAGGGSTTSGGGFGTSPGAEGGTAVPYWQREEVQNYILKHQNLSSWPLGPGGYNGSSLFNVSSKGMHEGTFYKPKWL
ncbi:hypothetical protein CEUSTIGMA_g8572.t1 [Chlamydomonas eustigma]|uniref:Uncharacterized protein n=1 Tax=Chlamydomonas eustigma TaxID=1157962 RepID=A0A250XDI6_9CHLO|nr:hypothetical protein CEUSTIGMA_g8572.t1 [Chlamydomonas eustigma]|eukprot:GAX81138.1 hypothetical protein CEUSTIGMA_g8572.t1 [Chlamydomonas eustigma]